MPLISMEDHLGIVYLVENAQQFWSELEDVLHIPNDDSTTLIRLDSTLKRFLSLCAAYHEQYLQSPLQLGHACELLLDSELFVFHSERMCEILADDAKATTNPHSQLILYNVLLHFGRRQPNFFRSSKRWEPLIPLLMDHVLVEIDPDVEDTYFGMGNYATGSNVPIPIPIEAKLRSLGVKLLYEVCRVQKLSMQDLRIYDDSFLDYLFDLVEQTRNMQDETFNYSVIKLIVSLNEQFMVASLRPNGTSHPAPEQPKDHTQPFESKNRVLRVLMRRLGSSKTFGENMIFMLNRANRTPEDLCMQLLVLKILYLLFTTKGTSEYFYTNDLCVLVDVFLRELADLDEESESLRHTFLRVLHPLLTKTQLRSTPYKRPQIVQALESLMQNGCIRDISPTTKRLVERCLAGEWCVQLKTNSQDRGQSPSSDSVASAAQAQANLEMTLGPSMSSSAQLERTGSLNKGKSLKLSKSMEFVKGSPHQHSRPPPRSPVEYLRRPSNASSFSLMGVAAATPPTPHPAGQSKRRDTTGARSADVDGSFVIKTDRHRHAHPRESYSEDPSLRYPHEPLSASSLPSSPVPGSNPVSVSSSTPPVQVQAPTRRSAPPTPGKRRKPPAVPPGRPNGRPTITTLKTSAHSSPLSITTKPSNSKLSTL